MLLFFITRSENYGTVLNILGFWATYVLLFKSRPWFVSLAIESNQIILSNAFKVRMSFVGRSRIVPSPESVLLPCCCPDADYIAFFFRSAANDAVYLFVAATRQLPCTIQHVSNPNSVFTLLHRIALLSLLYNLFIKYIFEHERQRLCPSQSRNVIRYRER